MLGNKNKQAEGFCPPMWKSGREASCPAMAKTPGNYDGWAEYNLSSAFEKVCSIFITLINIKGHIES